jgi:ribosomal protein L32E
MAIGTPEQIGKPEHSRRYKKWLKKLMAKWRRKKGRDNQYRGYST